MFVIRERLYAHPVYPFLGYKKELDKSTRYIDITETETKLML